MVMEIRPAGILASQRAAKSVTSSAVVGDHLMGGEQVQHGLRGDVVEIPPAAIIGLAGGDGDGNGTGDARGGDAPPTPSRPTAANPCSASICGRGRGSIAIRHLSRAGARASWRWALICPNCGLSRRQGRDDLDLGDQRDRAVHGWSAAPEHTHAGPNRGRLPGAGAGSPWFEDHCVLLSGRWAGSRVAH